MKPSIWTLKAKGTADCDGLLNTKRRLSRMANSKIPAALRTNAQATVCKWNSREPDHRTGYTCMRFGG